MRKIIVLIVVLLSISNLMHGQNRTIYGRVIAEDDLLPLPAVSIRTLNKIVVGKTDIEGKFKINIPQNAETLLLSAIGFEPITIKLNNDCDTIEVVMLGYDFDEFASSRKIDRERLKRFNELPELHLQAYKKGLFTKATICYTRVFVPDKPKLDSIGKEMAETKKKIKIAFRRLNLGDTVRIPFSDAWGYRADGTDRTILTTYTSYTGGHGHRSGCIVKCVVLSKNRHTRGFRLRYRSYNIVCKVVDCSRCKDPSVYDEQVMKPGVIFTYNMRYGEILGTQNFQ